MKKKIEKQGKIKMARKKIEERKNGRGKIGKNILKKWRRRKVNK